MNNILVTGSSGQLALEIKDIACKYKNYTFFFTDFKELDITNHDSVYQFILKNDINIIINCAAYTDVNRAEFEEDKANLVNNLAVCNLATISKDFGIKFIHISTDYVFDGKKKEPYEEKDLTNPISVYGKTKLNGEIAIRKINPHNTLIIRTSWLYSKYGKNFLKNILNLAEDNCSLKVVSDQIGSPTSAADLAAVILKLVSKIKNKKVEILHFANNGQCSWFEFASEIMNIKGLKKNLVPIYSDKLSKSAKRPAFSALNNKVIKEKYNIEVLNWKKALERDLKKIGYLN